MEGRASVSIEARVLSRSGGPWLSLAEHRDYDPTTRRRPSSGGPPQTLDCHSKRTLSDLRGPLADLAELVPDEHLSILEDGLQDVVFLRPLADGAVRAVLADEG